MQSEDVVLTTTSYRELCESLLSTHTHACTGARTCVCSVVVQCRRGDAGFIANVAHRILMLSSHFLPPYLCFCALCTHQPHGFLFNNITFTQRKKINIP